MDCLAAQVFRAGEDGLESQKKPGPTMPSAGPPLPCPGGQRPPPLLAVLTS